MATTGSSAWATELHGWYRPYAREGIPLVPAADPPPHCSGSPSRAVHRGLLPCWVMRRSSLLFVFVGLSGCSDNVNGELVINGGVLVIIHGGVKNLASSFLVVIKEGTGI